jgi:hypothetical protein
MTNWKTTLGGLITAVGAYLQTVPEPTWLATVGKIMIGLGPLLIGFFAKDKNVSNAPNPVTSAVVPKDV